MYGRRIQGYMRFLTNGTLYLDYVWQVTRGEGSCYYGYTSLIFLFFVFSERTTWPVPVPNSDG